jgi:hypothetical protein
MAASRRSNDELLQRLEQKNPLLGLGCSYSPYPIRLWIHEMKHAYVECFRFASKHVHFIHFKARSRLPNDVVAKVEDDLRAQILRANEDVDEAIVQAETLMKANGITLAVTDTPNCSPPLCHTAEIISPLTNRYIQLIEKTDYLLRALDLLFQQEVIPIDEYNRRRGHFKKHVKRFYYACRRFDEGLRARMNAFEAAAAHRRPKAIKRSTEGVGPTVAAGVAPASKSASSSEEREANASEAKEAMSAV